MEYLFSAWAEFRSRLVNAGHVLALTDFDGTLAPIAARPEMAALPDRTRELLQALARRRRFTIGVLSGRAIDDLKKKIGIDSIIYSGNHGLEIEASEVRVKYPLPPEIEPELRAVYSILMDTVERMEGVVIENKALSLSVHYRQVKEGDVGEFKKAFRKAVSRANLSDRLRISTGKKVFEIRPAVCHKGNAVQFVLDKFAGYAGNLLPLYLGDDRTDEDAFRTIRCCGIPIYVGSARHRSQARYFLRSPTEVGEFLSKLLEVA